MFGLGLLDQEGWVDPDWFILSRVHCDIGDCNPLGKKTKYIEEVTTLSTIWG